MAHQQVDGSSPHTRGAPRALNPGGVFSGIIPAYAGSTRADPRVTELQGDHPRIRGEHDTPLTNVTPFTGSSPHTRGARPTPSTPEESIWIIPAYAGSTCRRCRKRLRARDHPRIRGEHRLSGLYTGDGQGSSPHTRGARSGVHRHRRPERIIPAYAGSTRYHYRIR